MVYQGKYYLDAASTASYDGFTLWNWRGSWQINPHWRVFARVMNIGDTRYADRADFAFGTLSLLPRYAATVVCRVRNESWRLG